MMYPVIGAYRLGDKVRIEIDGVLREGEIICVGHNGYVVAADACFFVVNDPQIKWCARTSGENEPGEEIKVGDRVEVLYQSGNRCGIVCEIKYDGTVDVDFGGGCIGHDILQGRIRKLDCPKKQPHDNTITIPVKADLDDTYWDAYKAELVKEIAVKVANNNTINDSMIAYHIIGFATQIVDNLKKQSE